MSEKEKMLFSVLTDLVQSEVLDPVVAEEFWEGRHNV
jgi:hypothetical protein